MINFSAIGFVESEYNDIANMPIQGCKVANNQGVLVIDAEFTEGLADLHEFSHLYVLFHLHRCNDYTLKVKPFLDNQLRGIFATRSPKRPNPIGLSIVEIERIEDNRIYVKGIDILNQTPIIDIKPYIQAFDNITPTRDGWYEHGQDPLTTLSDNRFIGK
ncbi:tRNA (N6-threonylcarbamoyladenosine(37)-N6)-methyltransferase TrmO [Shewanella glacialipiscicola]|uniref:tRNA (N6-threonylcarbamoyladenosine(37)-N6)-methyltransferase TrmO n=1 Tax=Shewanella glacialipiscicola TaxID=614069 RepID=A0ABQ6IYG3_9GAMM|nr:tRNA (N6-threonylcarbamoyladenosine(37)-N6)-methyltransferase TrmO [Shewanella glacialipiscicola]MCL1086132.1 tRNA (N6-threonylcarbamoyladenosine(37)-N6)-methyltransferase TrmO [Shewanella glacialipiscicola]GIU16667.1 tRNA (N6-threonylcarbamoyladenosine(37)-N6)-methyltransferase TrmO [Shewanella glacialipiscicola]GMA80903.1 tRNA (N6-threonylcarbamoyladenosine(37)-N6)-methyltransferase TrmO [Shewanella glacialipiscicola]